VTFKAVRLNCFELPLLLVSRTSGSSYLFHHNNRLSTHPSQPQLASFLLEKSPHSFSGRNHVVQERTAAFKPHGRCHFCLWQDRCGRLPHLHFKPLKLLQAAREGQWASASMSRALSAAFSTIRPSFPLRDADKKSSTRHDPWLLLQSMQPQNKSELTLQMPKPPQPKFPRSLSRELGVCKRKQVLQRLGVFSQSGVLTTWATVRSWNALNALTRRTFTLTSNFFSDGIARVHGMSNVQAEELVE
jgi:hypothetical protein